MRVAVLDSGVDDTHIPVVCALSAAGGGAVTFFHGTAVAGLVAGQPRDDGTEVGIAPDAQVVDVRVYDGVDDEDGEPLTPDGSPPGWSG